VLLLALFAFLAGAATALSPCVLPVLPVALTAGATGGRRRPLGVVTGLAISHTFAIVALVYVVDALGLPDTLLRTVAIVVLIVFGAALIVPAASAQLEARLSRLTTRAPTAGPGEGFGSGFVLGLGLGLVYAPCAGPILAGVITVSASQDFSAGRLVVALAYGIGSAVSLYVLMLGGRKLISRLAPQSGRFQIASGVVMVAVAVAMLAGLDTRFQAKIADDLPAFLVNPTKDLEASAGASERLAGVRDAPAGHASPLEILGEAPEFTGNQRWFNTPGGQPLTLKGLRGKVVLVDFWTYTCINCLRTLPYLKAWDSRHREEGLQIVGVHTPEFAFEKKASNVEQAIKDNGISYAVAQDNEFGTWNAYGNMYWPAKYLIDAQGRVRYTHFGEGDYEETEEAIRGLLEEATAKPAAPPASPAIDAEGPQAGTSPETYLGAARTDTPTGIRKFSDGPAADAASLTGVWKRTRDGSTAVRDATLDYVFRAEKVFLVLSGPGSVRVELDGKPIPARFAGEDVKGGRVAVRKQRLYRLVDLPDVDRHRLTLRFDPGVSGYAFTFG
jgi:cytochrome c biogenesis protein CcdA/thiol-disulfide isomerase/thioredoxin